jgi:AraC-like DNA-binding protein
MVIECISFSGIVVSILCILLLFSKKDKKHSDYYLVLWLLICSLNLAYYLFPSALSGSLQSFAFTLPVLSISMLYLYVISMIFGIRFQSKYIVKHSLFFLFYNLIFILISSFYEKIIFTDNIPSFTSHKHGLLLNLLTFPMAVIPIIYIVLCFSALKKYQKLLPEYFSSLEKINLNWLQYILISIIFLFIIVIIIISFGTRLDLIPMQNIFKIVGTLQSIYVCCIVFFSLRQSIIINQNISVDNAAIGENKGINKLSDDKLNKTAADLVDYMADEKPYLNEELSLSILSSLMGVSTNQLSQVINQNLNTNFYKFVNAYRIEDVKKKLKDPDYDRYSILGIAYESGFNSKSTFNKIFKEETGMTPSEYKRSE